MGIFLKVENLSAGVTDNDLVVRFSEYGTVESATMESGSPAATGKRSAWVVMSNREDAEAAIDWLHDTVFRGSTISVVRAVRGEKRAFWLHLDR